MNEIRKQNKKPLGFTLLELTLSIAFYTFILIFAVISFVGILNTYNRAQGLTRTQLQARNAMDSLVRDLRLTNELAIPTVQQSNAIGTTINIWCLRGNGFERGYASFQLNSDPNHAFLIRMQTCTTLNNYEMLVGTDTWIGVIGNPTPCGQIVERVVGSNTRPPVWRATVSVARGDRIPCQVGLASDSSLSAATTLQTIVTNQ